MKPRLLIVEDDASLATVLAYALTEQGWAVERAADGDAGAARLAAEGFDLALVDLALPGRSGLEVLRAAAAGAPPRPIVIMMTAHGSIESAIEAMKLGAADYLIKPFSMEELALRVGRARDQRELKAENAELRRRLRAAFRPEDFVGRSPRFLETLALIRQAAESEATVLLTGESGTGKELAARCLHALSRRAEGPFVVVNCAAIPAALIESELFGHLKGAFTGALAAHTGKFERAAGGTLFLDEIGELAPDLQAKFLRAVQEREVEPVGGTRPVPVDVRLVAATNTDLRAAVAAGRFREDLFYRLNVFPIPLPALRERLDDLPLLAAHCLKQAGRSDVSLAPATAEALRAHRWPGNVRELAHALERALVLIGPRTTITPDLLPPEVRGAVGTPLKASHVAGIALPERGIPLEDVERSLLTQALERTGGNQTRAAALLGLTRATLIYRMGKFGLKKP